MFAFALGKADVVYGDEKKPLKGLLDQFIKLSFTPQV